ncbi:MAG: hypothetical protein ACTSUE_00045, partial [Promethearchaeota archaeon]
MRYFFKIIALSLLDTGGDSGRLLNELFTVIDSRDDEFLEVPGVSIKNAEIDLDGETVINAEFWLVDDVTTVNIEEAFKGSDGIILCVDPGNEQAASMTRDYLDIIRREFHFLPALILGLAPGAPVSEFNREFARDVWNHYTCEYMNVNRSFLPAFRDVVDVLMRGIVKTPASGPVNHDNAWIRVPVMWDVLNSRLETTSSDDDMEFMGRNFYALYNLALHRGKLEAHVLGSIASKWLEMSGQYLLAFKVSDELGDASRAKFLKKKYLNSLIDAGNDLYGQRRFKEAALSYEKAAHWNRVEGVDHAIGDNIFKKAMDAWASAIDYEKIIDLLPQVSAPATFLATLKSKIAIGLDVLERKHLLEKANYQLGTITRMYLKHDLRDTALEFAARHARVKLDLLREKIRDKFVGDSLLLIEQLKELNDTLSTDFEIPDECIAAVSRFLIDRASFQEFEKLLSLVRDKGVLRDLAKQRIAKEQEISDAEKRRDELLKRGVYERLSAYLEEERLDATRYAMKRRKILFDTVQQGREEKAFHFLLITAKWLVDIGQGDIAADLTRQVLNFLVTNDFKFDFQSVQGFLPVEMLSAVAAGILEHSRHLVEADNDDVYLSSFLEHYFGELQEHNFYDEANEMKLLVVNRLGKECEMLVKDINEQSVNVILEKLEQIDKFTHTWKLDKKTGLNRDPVLEKIIQFWIDTRQLENVSKYLNTLDNLELKKKFTYQLNRIHSEDMERKVGDQKLQERVRLLEDRYKEIRLSLLAGQHGLSESRRRRKEVLDGMVGAGKVPSKLACMMVDEKQITRDLKQLQANQMVLLKHAMDQRMQEEAATSLVVLALLALKSNRLESIDDALQTFQSYPDYVRKKIEDRLGFALVLLIQDAIKAEKGSMLVEAAFLAELLPIIKGERVLAYSIAGKAIPPSILVVSLDPKISSFKRKVDDVLPALIELVSMELEPTRESMVVKRQLLAKKGSLESLECIAQGKIEKVPLHYQHE